MPTPVLFPNTQPLWKYGLPIKSIFLCSSIIASSGLPLTTFALSEGDIIEEIIVTGSRIKRQDFFSASPIFTISQDDFKRAGITNIEDILNDAPQMTPAEDRTSNNPGTGIAGINLRGLGTKRTLSLQNGRRIAPANVFGAVDANNIPAALIDRIEIVTGGASAVYGSDAMAGAVNFILKTEFEGVAIDFQQDVYGDGDGEVSDLSLTFGKNFADGRANLTAYYGYQNRKAVFQSARAISEFAIVDDQETGELGPFGSPATPGGVSVFPAADIPGIGVTDEVLFLPDGTARPYVSPDDAYNFAGPNYLQIPLRRDTAGLFGRYDLSDDTRISLEINWSNNRVSSQLAPAPVFSFVSQSTDHPLLSDFQRDLLENNFDFFGTGIAQFFFLRRLTEIGPRQFDRDSDSIRTALAIDGAALERFSWNASYTYSKTDIKESLNNTPSFSRIQQGLITDPATGGCLDPSNGCVPLTLLGDNSLDAAALDFIRLTDVANFSEFKEQIISASISGALVEKLNLQVAAGFEWRKQNGRFFSSDTLKSGDAVGFSASDDVKGSIEVWEVYGELVVPLLSDKPLAQFVNLELGYRYSNYSDSDSTNTWKAGLDWQFNDLVRVRAMQQRAIRTPNITELFQTPSTSQSPFGNTNDDLCSADRDPVGNGFTDLCIAQGIPADQIGIYTAAPIFPNTQIVGSGSLNLESETADTTTFGFVITPAIDADLSIAIDYFNISIEDAISEVGNPIPTCFELNDPDSQFCQLFSRGPSLNITEVQFPFANQAERKTSGVDLQILYTLPLAPGWDFAGEASSLRLSLVATTVFENSIKLDPATPRIDCVGYFAASFSKTCPTFMTPENRVNISIAYDNSTFTTALTWKWIDGAKNAILLENDPTIITAVPSIGSYAYLDFSAGYTFNDSFQLRGGISNLLEEKPPLLAINNGTQANTNPQIYDVYGRRFFLGLSVSF